MHICFCFLFFCRADICSYLFSSLRNSWKNKGQSVTDGRDSESCQLMAGATRDCRHEIRAAIWSLYFVAVEWVKRTAFTTRASSYVTPASLIF